jgi:hypothetical protein
MKILSRKKPMDVMLLTQNAKSVVYRDNHQVGVASKDAAIIRVPRIPLIRFPVNVHQHRVSVGRVCRPHCNIKEFDIRAMTFVVITFPQTIM